MMKVHDFFSTQVLKTQHEEKKALRNRPSEMMLATVPLYYHNDQGAVRVGW
tara:strand:+ start:492 stop:644 length:153 start_codon:yes stop_codon:yes gene_type:complete